MERRSSLRRPIHLRASLSLGDLKPQSCVISDFCPGGLFLQYGATSAQFLAHHGGQLAGMTGIVIFTNPVDQQEYRLAVKVARVLDGAMGVQLAAPNSAALAAMERIARAEEVRQTSAVQSNSATTILRQCARTIQAYLKPLFEQFLQELGPALIQAAAVAPNDAMRTSYLDAEAVFRTQPGRITSLFFQELAAPLNAGERARGGGAAPTVTELSLIEKTEFEHWLTLKVMITKAETEYRGNLLQLKLRLDKIGYASSVGYQNPLGPPLIGYAFRDTLVTFKLSPHAEKVCYRLFEWVVMKQLDALYQELNLVLIRAGVLPELDLSKYLSPKTRTSEKPARTESPRAESPPQAATAKPAMNAPSAESAAEMQDQLQHANAAFSTLSSLFGVLDQVKQKLGVARATPAPAWSREDLQHSLAELQTQRLQSSVLDPQVSLRQQLEALLRRNTGNRKELPAEQRESVDVVDQFFGSLVRNARLSDTAKVQVKRLELPVLKMLMRDRKLFEKRDTTILAVINRIAELGASGARPSPVHNERVAKLINRICEQIDDDTAVLDEAMAELNDMLERQNLLFRRNVERVAAAAEGAQKVADSKRIVAEEINRRIQGRPVPRAIAGLINGGWRDLLSLTYIRQGPDSPAWRNYLGVLDVLLAVNEDPSHDFNLADLLQLIQEGLASISSNHMPSGNIRDDLKKFLTRPAGTAVDTVELRVAAEQDSQDDARTLGEIRRRGLQRWLVRAQKFRVGDWARFVREGEDAQHVRLVWVGKGQSRYVFVNHQGMKVVDLDQYKLATYLQRGIMVPDPGHETSVVDQSLDAMVKEVYDQLSHAASHDEVTKLANRKEFERSVEAALANAEGGLCFSLIHLDLRQFKMLNDTAGADAGDQILAEVADLLRGLTPDPDIMARLGGNEFGVLVAQDQAEALAQRYLKAVQGYRLQWQNRSYSLAVSMGVADLAADFTDVAQALKLAEQACRRSKSEGVNRIYHLQAGAQPADQQERIIAKIAGMRDDLKGERILLRCQKVIPLRSDTRIGNQYQVMFTIYDDQGQLIPAYDFVRLAERHNRMQVVDRWMVGQVLDWMAQNQAKLDALGGLSLSLSGHSLNDEKLQEFIFERATQTGAPLEKLCFEITEAAAISNVHDVADFMQELREYGVRFCLANFGSGLSSYKFLKMLPVDLIRIDGSFVKGLAQDAGDQMMIRSMTEMVHFLGKELIATQVEDKAALELLRSLNVDYAQGYGIEKPCLLSSL